jgi:tripartite ATP-independent transporter DctM subunit
MSGAPAAIAAFGAMLLLMQFRVPVGVAMAIVGVGGFGLAIGWNPAFSLMAQSPIRYATDETMGLVPMFILMGAFAVAGGLGRELFNASNTMIGHRRGGLAVATIWASAGFAAICGSAVASAATMARIVLPEMKRLRYDGGFACATVAVGGTLGIMIPPSIVLALYGIMVEQDIAKLFIAGIVPGILAVIGHLVAIRWTIARNPEKVTAAERHGWPDAFRALKRVWAVVALLLFILGGMYGGVFTATEAASMGAGGALLIGLARRKLPLDGIKEALASSARTTGAIFIVIIGAVLFQQFLAVTRAPQDISEWVGTLPFHRYVILAIILAMYLVLGAIMDEIAMILLTVPIVYPIIVTLGFDPIWFGVILVMTVELGLIMPPIAMNLFVLHNIAKEVSLVSIYRAVIPFIVVDILRLVVLCAFPALSTWLPSTMS